MKRLFECRYELVYYAITDTEMAAQAFLRRAILAQAHDGFRVRAHEVWHRDWKLAPGWVHGSLVHEEGQADTTVGEALARLAAYGSDRA